MLHNTSSSRVSLPLMNARLERQLRLLAWIIAAGIIAGIVFNLAQGRANPISMLVGITYGLSMSVILGSIELFVLEGSMRAQFGSLSFTAGLLVRSSIYVGISRHHPVASGGREGRRAAPRNVRRDILVRPGLFHPDLGCGQPGARHHQHHRPACISQPRRRAIPFPGRGKSLRALRRYRGVDRPRRSGLAGSPFTGCWIARFACSPLRWWIIAVRSSTMSAMR